VPEYFILKCLHATSVPQIHRRSDPTALERCRDAAVPIRLRSCCETAAEFVAFLPSLLAD